MRDIRFRAWHKQEQTMYDAVGIWFDMVMLLSPNRMATTYTFNCLPKEQVELMQFTGLKDRHDKDIYEGDILKGEEGFTVLVEAGFSTPDVSLFLGRENGSDLPTLCTKADDFEIIGNLYENPELMKASQDE